MGLKKLFGIMKNEGIVIPAIDKYLLLSDDSSSEDRGHGLNSPSGASSCPLSQYYTRKGERKDGAIEPRARRIFNNGTYTHIRLQEYLLKAGILLMDEVPVWDWELSVLGHTDGILKLNEFTLGVLEIKSINSNGFSKLIDAKDEHKQQAQVYMTALEKLRKRIHDNAKTKREYIKYKRKVLKKFEKLLNTFVTSGRKYTKEEKIKNQLECMTKALDILWDCSKRIEDMIFLYENKDTQDLKEFRVKWNDDLVKELEDKYKFINKCVAKNKAPKRPEEATGKSCGFCRWCNYKLKCWH